MKDISYTLFGFSGFVGAVLLSYVGHLWLPKSTILWLFPVSGVIVLWLVVFLAIALFCVWSIFSAASAHHEANLDFGMAQLGRAIVPSAAAVLAILVINGVALWLL